MQLGDSIRHGTFWLFTGSIAGKILQFIIGIILARLLFPEDFGLVVTAQVFTGIAGFFAAGGMGQALVQAKHVEKQHFHTVFTVQLFICLLIYIFFYFISPYFAKLMNNSQYIQILRLSALNFIFRPFLNTSQSKLRREMRFKAIAVVGFFSAILSGTVSITLAYNGYGPLSLIYGGLSGLIISIPASMILAKLFPRLYYNHSILKKLGSYGIKFSIINIIEYLSNQAPNFLLGKFMGPQTVGLFNKGESLSALPFQMVAGSTYQTIFRALSSTQDNLDKCKYIYLRTVTLVSVYTFPFYIAFFWLSDEFIITVYGEKWALAAIPLQIIAIGKMFDCITNPSGAILESQNHLGTEMILQIMKLLLTIIGCWYGIQMNSLLYISLGLIPSYFFLMIFTAFFSLRVVKANYKDLFIALRPAILLNSLLALTLLTSDLLLQHYFSQIANSNMAYLLIQSSIGFLFYLIIFLFLPIKALEKEKSRWKQKLRIPVPAPQT